MNATAGWGDCGVGAHEPEKISAGWAAGFEVGALSGGWEKNSG